MASDPVGSVDNFFLTFLKLSKVEIFLRKIRFNLTPSRSQMYSSRRPNRHGMSVADQNLASSSQCVSTPHRAAVTPSRSSNCFFALMTGRGQRRYLSCKGTPLLVKIVYAVVFFFSLPFPSFPGCLPDCRRHITYVFFSKITQTFGSSLQ